MIDYETFCKIRLSYRERGLNFTQIARELGVHPQTVAKYARSGIGHAPAQLELEHILLGRLAGHV